MISLASIHKLFIHQMDVKTTFLNRDLEEEIYMLQLEGCITLGQENKVCKLRKSLSIEVDKCGVHKVYKLRMCNQCIICR